MLAVQSSEKAVKKNSRIWGLGKGRMRSWKRWKSQVTRVAVLVGRVVRAAHRKQTLFEREGDFVAQLEISRTEVVFWEKREEISGLDFFRFSSFCGEIDELTSYLVVCSDILCTLRF